MSSVNATRATPGVNSNDRHSIGISQSTDTSVPVVAPVAAPSHSAAAAVTVTPPPAATTGATRYRGGGKLGRKNWQPRHIDRMLSFAEKCMPAGNDGWERCAKLYNEGIETVYARTGIQLREKFAQLMRNKGQTGNTELNQQTGRALAIQERIEERQSQLHSLSITESTAAAASIDQPSHDLPTHAEPDEAAMPLHPIPPTLVPPASTHGMASSASSPSSPERINLKRKRDHSLCHTDTCTLLRESLDRDREHHSLMRDTFRIMSESLASLTRANQAAERRHEEREARDEERHNKLMALILAREKK